MNEDDFAELVERDVKIQELTQHPGWEVLRDLLLERYEAVQRGLLDGSCKDFSQYRYDAGRWQGVRDALEAPLMHSKRLELARDEMERARVERLSES